MPSSSNPPELQRSFRGHRGGVQSLSFQRSMRHMASAAVDGNVMLWNFKPTVRAHRLVGHTRGVHTVSFNNDGSLLASGAADATIRLWVPSIQGGSSFMKAHAATVRCVTFSPDGRRLWSASDDKSVKLWSVETQRFAGSFLEHRHWVRTVACAKDGRSCASAGEDRVVCVWDAETRQRVCALEDFTEAVYSVKFHPNGHLLAAAGLDRHINIYDLRMRALLQRYDAHHGCVHSVDFDPTGRWLLSASADGAAKLWELTQGLLHCEIKAHEGMVQDAIFSPSGDAFATAGRDGLIMVWSWPDVAHSGRHHDLTEATPPSNPARNGKAMEKNTKSINTAPTMSSRHPLASACVPHATHERMDPTNVVPPLRPTSPAARAGPPMPPFGKERIVIETTAPIVREDTASSVRSPPLGKEALSGEAGTKNDGVAEEKAAPRPTVDLSISESLPRHVESLPLPFESSAANVRQHHGYEKADDEAAEGESGMGRMGDSEVRRRLEDVEATCRHLRETAAQEQSLVAASLARLEAEVQRMQDERALDRRMLTRLLEAVGASPPPSEVAEL